MNRINLKLSATMIILLVAILFPLGFVINQIFYQFNLQQAQDESLYLAKQYASLISDSSVESRIEVVEVSAKLANQKLIVMMEDREILANANIALDNESILYLSNLLENEHHSYLTNSFQTPDGLTYLATASPILFNNVSGHVIMFSSLESILQSMETVQWLLMIAIIGSILLGVGFAIFFSTKLSQPLVSMEKAARQMAKGDLAIRVREESNDEIGSLAGAINDLAAELEKVNSQRKEFIANITHDLQTPITYLKGYTKALKQKLWKSELEQQQYFEIIEEEANRLSSLVNDLFDLTKMDEGRLTLHKEQINVDEFLHFVVKKPSLHALERNTSIQINNHTKQNIYVYADPLRLEQVFINLLENAVRYTKDGVITLSVHADEEVVLIEITDTGVGMQKDELPFIFDRFYRVEKSRNREYGGSGLGLPIVKQLIDLHDGEIIVTSELGKGTTVSITLPRQNKELETFHDE
ncbi:histidine kinase [Alkalihalobacillus alcalophilus ATCC 27647 = CGMCC 1.3604]|uniref:histidine kinase n=1 Tax=Alkalihalobacillus alcalophilus ATCC 27647 = CGMCC 1.3604 TaxID=1218173 RepID=A0A094WL33_ALKAL|nr:HAMP domain-containing sensor histidine kinase [Alkalihalobacillus alcalophilus]KGA96648.1 histidine kinase [Alkalihalobacillus alcalophilus ATCC 27647 = CGMCC 1.3604]MED1561841.1 HAMP domain-containing sensor histidine kinase [Alkalihalobacillus alcalophilus]THG91005.1 histidine kinase [Alkalihalobacillus alcalophilus ATCC 27647 = CGMCC 1.3604]